MHFRWWWHSHSSSKMFTTAENSQHWHCCISMNFFLGKWWLIHILLEFYIVNPLMCFFVACFDAIAWFDSGGCMFMFYNLPYYYLSVLAVHLGCSHRDGFHFFRFPIWGQLSTKGPGCLGTAELWTVPMGEYYLELQLEKGSSVLSWLKSRRLSRRCWNYRRPKTRLPQKSNSETEVSHSSAAREDIFVDSYYQWLSLF